MHTNTPMQMHIYTHMHICTHMYTHAFIHTYTYTPIHMYTCSKHACTYTCTHMHTQSCTKTRFWIYLDTKYQPEPAHLYAHICMHTCVQTKKQAFIKRWNSQDNKDVIAIYQFHRQSYLTKLTFRHYLRKGPTIAPPIRIVKKQLGIVYQQ